jgi:hypothetical protein
LKLRIRHVRATLPSLPNLPTARNYIGRNTGVNIENLAVNPFAING